MKRILFIIPSLGLGGLERMQITIANKLVQQGYDVTVMTLSSVDDLTGDLDNRVHFVYRSPKQHIGNKIPYIRHIFYDDGMWETRASAEKLYKYYIGNEHYDVEIAFFRGMPVKIISGSPRSNGKIFTTISRKSVGARSEEQIDTDFNHEIVVRLAWVHTDFKYATGFQNNFKNMQQVYHAYKRMDKVVCVSNQAMEGFKEVIGDTENLITIYNMLPTDEIRKKADLKPKKVVHKSSFHIVLVARLLDSAKGQKRMIEVVHRLHEESHDISLALIGDGADEQILRELIHRYNAGDYIIMTGSQINPYPYIKEADLLVCASYFEGYNLTVAEALILGTPVLSTDCTGPNEILDYGKYGMIVENSEKGLYNGLKQFVDNPELLSEYREKALQRQDFFNEEKILKQITDLF